MPAHSQSLLTQFQEQLAESEGSDRSFGLLVGFVLLGIGFLPLLRHGGIRWGAVAAAGLLLLLALAAPQVLRQPKRVWLFLGFLLGLVVNPIVLGILFFVVITPAGLLMRLLGRDPLALRQSPRLTSYWRTRTTPASDMNDQF